MNRARRLLSHINLLNIMLTGVLFFLVAGMMLPFVKRSLHYSLPVIVKPGEPESGLDKQTEQPQSFSPFDYAMIA